jgi:hypothetical protein
MLRDLYVSEPYLRRRIGPGLEGICRCPLPATLRPGWGRVEREKHRAVRVWRPVAVQEGGRMSTQSIQAAANGSAELPVGTTDPAATPTPTITHYQQLAAQFSKAFWQAAAIIPNVEKAHPNTLGYVRTHQNVPKPFMDTAIVAVEKDPVLGAVDKLAPTDGRDKQQYEQAFNPIADELQKYVDDLRYTIQKKMADLGVGSLQIYQVAKALSRDSNSGDTAKHAAKLKHELKKKGGRSKKAKAGKTPPTPPASPGDTTPAGTPASPGTSAPAGGKTA